MPMHWVPWLAGGFLLTPFLVWLGLQAFVFPGAWNGFTTVVGTAALVASLPLAAWFYIRGIGGFANAMAGADPDGELAHGLPRLVLRVLPVSAVVFGVAGAAAVLVSAQPALSALAPLVVGAVTAAGIRAGEHGVSRGLVHLPPRLAARVRARLMRNTLVRELALNEGAGRRWFVVNLLLLGALVLFAVEVSPAALTVILITLAVAGGTAYMARRERAARRGRSTGGDPNAAA